MKRSLPWIPILAFVFSMAEVSAQKVTAYQTVVRHTYAHQTGKELFIVVGDPRNTTAATTVKALSAAYGSQGFSVHILLTPHDVSDLHALFKTVKKKNYPGGTTPDIVAFHYLGHGYNHPKFGTGINLLHMVPDPRGGYQRKDTPVRHDSLGAMLRMYFPPSAFLFALFDACYQGPALKNFPAGVNSGLSPLQNGIVIAATSDKTCGVGLYTDPWLQAFSTLPPPFPVRVLRAFNAISKKYPESGKANFP